MEAVQGRSIKACGPRDKGHASSPARFPQEILDQREKTARARPICTWAQERK